MSSIYTIRRYEILCMECGRCDGTEETESNKLFLLKNIKKQWKKKGWKIGKECFCPECAPYRKNASTEDENGN